MLGPSFRAAPSVSDSLDRSSARNIEAFNKLNYLQLAAFTNVDIVASGRSGKC